MTTTLLSFGIDFNILLINSEALHGLAAVERQRLSPHAKNASEPIRADEPEYKNAVNR